MKKYSLKKILMGMMAILFLMLSGCFPPNTHNGPERKQGEIWICEEHPVYWYYDPEIDHWWAGEMIVRDTIFPIKVLYGNGTNKRILIHFYLRNEEDPAPFSERHVFRGICTIPADDLQRITVDSRATDPLIEWDILTVRKFPMSEVSWVDGWPVPNTKAND